MTAVTQTKFAKIIGKTPNYVTELKKNGRLVLNVKGRVLVEESQQLIKETSDPSKQGVVDRHAENRKNKNQDAPSKYHDSRAKKEHFAALKAEIEHKQMVGELYNKKQVDHVAADAGTLARSRLENLPDIMAPQLAAEQDEEKIRAVLIDQVEFILAELERSFRLIGHKGAEDA